VTRLDPTTGESNHRWPYFLPDGRHFIYTASTGICCPAAKPAKIRVASLDSAEPAVTLFEVESAVTYASGHLLFVRDDTLMAQPSICERINQVEMSFHLPNTSARRAAATEAFPRLTTACSRTAARCPPISD
jgi:hypothetical protein